MAQWYCTVGGTKYGPIEVDVLRQWLAEGRAKPSDLVWTERMADWVPASSVSELSVPAAPIFPGGPPPVPNAPQAYPFAPQYAKPHRATMLLVFSILSWVVCVIFGIVAWMMANNDLHDMDAGVMDPAGREMTKAARVVAMAHVILALVAVGALLIFALVGGLTFHGGVNASRGF